MTRSSHPITQRAEGPLGRCSDGARAASSATSARRPCAFRGTRVLDCAGMSALELDCVTLLEYEGREIYLVGTAHVSQRSVEDVGRVVDELAPDTVCVELDSARHQALVDPKRWRHLDILDVIRQRRVPFVLTSLALSSYQRRLGEKLGVRPGAEMLAAIEHAERVGARLVLADRDIQATLKRTWAALSAWDCLQLCGAVVGSLFAKGEITKEQVEALKDRDNIDELVREFAEVMPRLQRPLIDERDRFLMSSIREAPGQRVVGVVGAGHVGGMVRYLHADVDRNALSEIPPPSWLSRIAPWVLPVLVLAAFYLTWRERPLHVDRLLTAWIIPNAGFVAAAALVARARLLTALLAALVAPLVALVPKLDAGMLAAWVEARLRPPTVADCEGLSQVASLADWRQNRFTRVLLVGFAASVGSTLGALVGAALVLLLF
jgi:pheromone shutdown-related protein TraB